MSVKITLSPSDVNLETVKGTVDEVNEWCARVQKTVQKMSHMTCRTYVDHLAELNVEINWLEWKAKSAVDAIDVFLESLPEED